MALSQRMALHQLIQRTLLLGALPKSQASPRTPEAPQRLVALMHVLTPEHAVLDRRAVHFGHRYRSGFWVIYLLSAAAVLCAIIPLALGWDDRLHALHPFAGIWAVAEVGVIGTVTFIYWFGHRRDWQGEWLHSRTTAELTWYLPLVAALVDFSKPPVPINWYLRVFDPQQTALAGDEVTALCACHESLAREMLTGAWGDAAFVAEVARWGIDVLNEQKHYHRQVALKQHALLHRVHRLNGWLFGMTALGALLHLVFHTLWLTLITTFFPALGASLHGALAQSEAYRLAVTSERLSNDLEGAIERLEAAAAETAHTSNVVRGAIADALALILEEHQDWQMLVRPHALPLG